MSLLKVNDVSKMLSISEVTVRRWVKSGYLPCLRFGKLIRFDSAVLAKWVEEKSNG